ncbi:MAG: hypothetical protein U0136_15790 [Bdellovibrionota bacterium]
MLRRRSQRASVTVRSLAVPALFESVAWSDDWSFWQQRYQAFSITDTAYLRSDSYHELSDTAESIDYEAMADVVGGVREMVRVLAMDGAHVH